MFINCPHCRSLVATDPATDRPPPQCPLCNADIEDSAPTPTAAHDRVAMHDDASRRLDAMLASIDDDVRAAAAALEAPAPDAEPGAAASTVIGSAETAAPETDANAGVDMDADREVDDPAIDSTGVDAPAGTTATEQPPPPPGPTATVEIASPSLRLNEPVPGELPPIDVIRAPVDAIAANGPALPTAAAALDDRRPTGIAGFLKRLARRPTAVAEAVSPPSDAPAAPDLASAAHDSEASAAAAVEDTQDPTPESTSRPTSRPTSTASPEGVSAALPSPADDAGPTATASGDVDPPPAIVRDADDSGARAVSASEPPVVRSSSITSADASDVEATSSADTDETRQQPADVPVLDGMRVESPPSPTVAHDAAEPAARALPAAPVTAPLPAPGGARTAPSFARPRRRAASGPGRITAAAIVVLGITLVLQVLLADRAALAANARWRPLVAGLCGALGCSVPPWREPAAFALVDRDVRPHPTRPGVLRVTASFRNDARWPQPWPRLALTLSDVDGAPLAMRDFSAREYLGAAPRQDALAPGQTASVAMDVVEPDTRSVAFDFQLH